MTKLSTFAAAACAALVLTLAACGGTVGRREHGRRRQGSERGSRD